MATKRTAVVSGNWNSTTTWGGQSIPGCVDTIVIPAGITVTITVTVNLTSCPPVYILVEGTLHFQSGKKLDLSTGSVVYIAPGGSLTGGGGGGNSNWVTIGGTTYWTAGDGNLSGPEILCQSCALGIELVDFTADLEEGVVIVRWQTASEENNDYFVIQRSKDASVWEDVITVDGAGNSSTLLDYTTQDNQPFLGVSYYRLKQIDMDGSFSYSAIRVVTNGNFQSDQELLVLSSASLTQHQVIVYFTEPADGDVELFIAGLNGSVIFYQTLQADHEKWMVITLDRPLAAGVYAVKANRQIERVFFQ